MTYYDLNDYDVGDETSYDCENAKDQMHSVEEYVECDSSSSCFNENINKHFDYVDDDECADDIHSETEFVETL